MLEYKPDFEEARRRWEAFWAGEIIDRPLTAIRAPKKGVAPVAGPAYIATLEGDYRPVVQAAVDSAATCFYGGDSIPQYCPSFGPDEVAAFIGAKLEWNPDSRGTSWSVPYVKDWDHALPFKLNPESDWWKRMLGICRALASATEGKILVGMVDLHTNMDLLVAVRGPQELCCDLLDMPETIDRAMQSSRAIFAPLYDGYFEAAGQGKLGTMSGPFYHPGKAGLLQCDFSCMMSPAMFRRWVLPALEEEVAYVDGSCYHWDGPDAMKHLPDLLSIEKLRVIQWVPGAGQPDLSAYMELFKQIQAAGKAVHIRCSAEQIPLYHKELKPEHVFYEAWAGSEKEAQEMLAWLEQNT